MNTEAFARSIDELYERLKTLTASKGEEYKRRDENQFANFERGAQALGLTREQVLMVYLSKHLDSITTYVKDRAAGQERQYAEPITGRIDDAILYLLLLRGMAVQNEVKTILDEMPRVKTDEKELCECGRVATLAECIDQHQAFRVPTAPQRDPKGRVLVMSSHQQDAVSMAVMMGLPAAASALSTTDQLHGVAPGAHVIFIHHGSRIDEAMYAEVIARCDKQGLTHERVDK